MSEDTTPEVATLEELREKFGANSVEFYRKLADEAGKERDSIRASLSRSEQRHENRNIALSRFESGVRQLLEDDSERVYWSDLAEPLKALGIELEQTWKACVTIHVDVTVKAMNREIAESLLNDFRTYEVDISNGDLDTWSVEEVEWSDLEEND